MSTAGWKEKCEQCKCLLSEAERQRSAKGFQEWAAKTPNATIISDQYYRGDGPLLGCPIPSYARLLCDSCRLKAYEWEIQAEEWSRSRPVPIKVGVALGCLHLLLLIITLMLTGAALVIAAQAR